MPYNKQLNLRCSRILSQSTLIFTKQLLDPFSCCFNFKRISKETIDTYFASKYIFETNMLQSRRSLTGHAFV